MARAARSALPLVPRVFVTRTRAAACAVRYSRVVGQNPCQVGAVVAAGHAGAAITALGAALPAAVARGDRAHVDVCVALAIALALRMRITPVLLVGFALAKRRRGGAGLG